MTPVRKFIGGHIEQKQLKRDKISDALLTFFDQNPDEFLFIQDICAKYDAAQSLVSGVLADLVTRRLIRVRYGEDGRKVVSGMQEQTA